MAPGEQINPEILVWARETAGLGIRDAAHKLAFAADDSSSESKLLRSAFLLPRRNLSTSTLSFVSRPVCRRSMPENISQV